MKFYKLNIDLIMPTISSIRRNNLLRLRKQLAEDFESNPENNGIRFTDGMFCEIVGISRSTFSQLKNKKYKPFINEVYVRNIELNLNLEVGWFDEDRDNIDLKFIKINIDKFILALDAFEMFKDSNAISINDRETKLKLFQNLFTFVFQQADPKNCTITISDFYKFLDEKLYTEGTDEIN
jgi:hypothetical protein